VTQRSLSKLALASCKGELTDYTVYKKLSEYEKNQQFKATLAKLADVEYRHYEFLSKYSSEKEAAVSNLTVYWIILLRRLLGVTFAIKYLERGEAKAVERYEHMAEVAPPQDREEFGEIIDDERQHEKEFSDRLEDAHVKYISFIVLGLADALVEVAGINAGSLGIYNSTQLAGLAGIVAGAAASIAMASAAYAQAKTGFKGSPRASAVYTGISYFATAAILAIPYFLTRTMVQALLVSLALGILLVAFISFYGSVLSDSMFRKDFAEMTGIMFGATAALYLLGTGIRYLTGMAI
jgi:VIT1/CCC1 family predicted Fe2+/Mn2+ transporter